MTELSVFKADSLSSAWDISQGLAKSDMLSPVFRGKPHNVMIALMLAQDIGVNPFTVMQNISVISGKPCFSTAFLIALANRHGVFQGPIDWTIEGKGKDLVVTATAILARSGMRVSYPVSMAMAQAEGWTKNSKYQTIPELMLRYRSAATLINLYCPEVKSGVAVDVEAETLPPDPVDPDVPASAETPLGAPQKRGKARVQLPVAKVDDVPVGPNYQQQLADLEKQIYILNQEPPGGDRDTAIAELRREQAAIKELMEIPF